MVENKETHEIHHYVEKPSTFVSTTINCGVYLCSLEIFSLLSNIFKEKHILPSCNALNGNNGEHDCISLEEDVIKRLTQTGDVFVFHTTKFWSQIKTAGSAIYANRHYLELFRKTRPEMLADNTNNNYITGPTIIGDVYIHPSASVDPSATV